MKKKLICAFSALWLAAPLLLAQTSAPPSEAPAVSTEAPEATPPESSTLGSELFYQLLVGEITARDGEASAGFALMLDAARKTNDAQLYQRATDIALQSRSGEAALQAAQAWKQAQATSREPNRYILQILIALNRVGATLEPLKTEIEFSPLAERPIAISSIPRAYARVSDKKLAAKVVEEALATYQTNPVTAGAAWTTIGRMRLISGDTSGAFEAAQKSQAADPTGEGSALVALELMNPKLPEAEVLVKKYLTGNPKALPEIRMGYARALLDAQRYAEATTQLQIVIREKPEFSAAWLVLGSLQLQDNQLVQAQATLERYVVLAQQQASEDESGRALAQAYLSLAQIAEKRKDFTAAESWIAKIEDSDELMQAQTRRASILASQGKLAEGRALIKGLPERNPGDARLKMLAEIGLLRDLKQYQLAYDLLDEAIVKFPDETELIYDQAMMAEKLGKLAEMETLLRRVIQAKPEYHNAYNALGYSFADRNVRLPEAKQLITKALEYVPADPFIQDSLGWVEFRLGNAAAAAKIFEEAFKSKPDAEIAAHFGEVLWSLGQHDKAIAIWREGQLLNPENETLLETLKRFRVKL
ncbi:MAG: tetratricopeptide repeat protein [Polaromonas sp.]|nr:tetratricopeptide repeat protein [Polaromonas sp.]